MAHQALKFAAAPVAAVAVACLACGPAATVAPSGGSAARAPNRAEIPADAAAWGNLHSSRFDLTVPLPDETHWVVDDKTRPELVAVHTATRSMLVAKTFFDVDLVNRARCEAKSREQGLVPAALNAARTIEDQALSTPDDFDTRIWVSMRAGKKQGELVGDVFVFGARIRKCIFVHYATIVASDQQADELSDRLAAARLHIGKDLRVDAIEGIPRDARR